MRHMELLIHGFKVQIWNFGFDIRLYFKLFKYNSIQNLWISNKLHLCIDTYAPYTFSTKRNVVICSILNKLCHNKNKSIDGFSDVKYDLHS